MTKINAQLDLIEDELEYKCELHKALINYFQDQMNIGNVNASVESTADSFDMSKRTFQRRLYESGLTFRKVRDQFRKAVTLRLLSETEVRINCIAKHVGFTDRTSLIICCKQWTGLSPTDYRKTNSA